MPMFLINARDKDGATSLRQDTRAAHLEWAKAAPLSLLVVGPILSDDEKDMIGSTFIVEADSLDAVQAWQKTDPYVLAGLFKSVEIVPFRWLLGDVKPPA